MKKLRLLTATLLAVCLVVTAAPVVVAAQGDPPVLDIERAIGNRRTFDLTEIAQDIAFVTLETGSRESLIGSIWGMVESKNMWYVQEGNSVKLFDRKGRFVSTRGVIGRGPDEFLMITGIAADWGSDNLYLLGRQSNLQILSYNSAGRVLARTNSEWPAIMAMGMTAFRNGKLIVVSQRTPANPVPDPDDRLPLLEVFSSDLKRLGSVDVTDRKVVPIVFREDGGYGSLGQGFLSDNGASLLVYEALDDTVFRLGSDMSLSPAYTLDFGRHAPPVKAFGRDASVPWSRNFRYIGTLWEGSRYVISPMLSNEGRAGTGLTEYLVFDLDSGDDGFSAVGASGEVGLFLSGVAFVPMYVRENRLVGYMQALDIVDAGESITNSSLRALADTLKEDSNPVVVVVTLK
ncbi:MAG: 6-bladed beta-propeller [Alistipes sp.]|nr:6-bladed beta-propeller [Alistipes sp.]